MEKRPEINMVKQDGNESKLLTKDVQVRDLQVWTDDIKSICKQLAVSSDRFDVEETYKSVEEFIRNHKRWLYSTVSTFLFDCNEQDVSTFISNLDGLRDYAYLQVANCVPEDVREQENREKLATAIDKLWDHSNLAQTQNQSLHDSDETFNARFEKNIIPFKSEFAHEMNMQFISLVAIFTALSFLVFGGISSLDNVFSNVGHVPILELIIVGAVWSLCITNLVFVFIFLIAKMTKLNIKSSEREGATLSQRYPFFVWCNFVLLLVLAGGGWLYFIDYANAGSWLLIFSRDNGLCTTVSGIMSIGIGFGSIAVLLLHKPKEKKRQFPDDGRGDTK